MSGLVFVPVPSIYQLSYIGYVIGHLIVRACKYSWQDVVRYFKKFAKIK